MLVVVPVVAIANKIESLHARRGKPKAGTDERDLLHPLLTFPDLKTEQGSVRDRLVAAGAARGVLDLWREWARTMEPDDEDDKFER